MKLKLIKCQICLNWFGPVRSHCPSCGAAKIKVAANSYIHINAGNESRPGIQIVSGLSRYHFTENALEIANILAGKD